MRDLMTCLLLAMLATTLSPAGKPAAGATVALATATTEPRAHGTGLELSSYGTKIGIQPVVTAEDGTFTLKSETDPAKLVAVHESGWAEIDLSDLAKPIT